MPQKKWNPEEYNAQCVLQYNTAMTMLDSVSFKGDEKVLDIGCGTGKITFQIKKERIPKGEILGLDVNKEMISFAQKTYQADKLNFVCEDVLKMDNEDHFDLAVSFWTLSWIPMENQLIALNNIIKSLNENGHLLLMYPLRHDAYDVVNEVIKKPKWQKYFLNYKMPRSFITEEQYRKEIINQIPMKINIAKKEIACHYKDDQEMLESINCWLAHVDEVPNEEKNNFLTDVVNAYKLYRGIYEPIMYYSTLEITGEKHTLELKFNNFMQM